MSSYEIKNTRIFIVKTFLRLFDQLIIQFTGSNATPCLGREVHFVVDVVYDDIPPSPSKVIRYQGLSVLLKIFRKGSLCGIIILKVVQRKDEH